MREDDEGDYSRSGAAAAGPLEALIRDCVTGWDAETVVRCAVRPDGKQDLTIISQRFEGLDSREREAIFWPVLDPVPKPEMIHLTYCLLLTPDEAARSFGVASLVSAAEDWDE